MCTVNELQKEHYCLMERYGNTIQRASDLINQRNGGVINDARYLACDVSMHIHGSLSKRFSSFKKLSVSFIGCSIPIVYLFKFPLK